MHCRRRRTLGLLACLCVVAWFCYAHHVLSSGLVFPRQSAATPQPGRGGAVPVSPHPSVDDLFSARRRSDKEVTRSPQAQQNQEQPQPRPHHPHPQQPHQQPQPQHPNGADDVSAEVLAQVLARTSGNGQSGGVLSPDAVAHAGARQHCSMRARAYTGTRRVSDIPHTVAFPVLGRGYKVESAWRNAFTKRGWVTTTNTAAATVIVSKQTREEGIGFGGLLCQDTQRFNQIPGQLAMTSKVAVLQTLRAYQTRLRQQGGDDVWTIDDFTPRTFILSEPTDCTDFIQVAFPPGPPPPPSSSSASSSSSSSSSQSNSSAGQLDANEVLWLEKQGYVENAKGVSVLDSHHLKRILRTFRDTAACEASSSGRIVQRYIQDPLLVRGHKVDLRIFVLVASVRPLLVLLYPHFMVRRASQPYRPAGGGGEGTSKEKMAGILTAVATDKKFAKDPKLLSNFQLSKEEFESYLWNAGILSDDDDDAAAGRGHWVDTMLLPNIARIVSRLIQATLPSLSPLPGYFSLYGLDLMLDESLHLWFLEINYSPQLSVQGASAWKQRLNDALCTEVVDVISALLSTSTSSSSSPSSSSSSASTTQQTSAAPPFSNWTQLKRDFLPTSEFMLVAEEVDGQTTWWAHEH